MRISLTLNYQENGVNPVDIEGANKMLLGFGYEIKELVVEEPEKPVRKRRTKATTKEEPKEEPKKEPKEEPKEEVITLDMVKDEARKALKDHDRDVVKGIIQKYGERIVDVDAKHYKSLLDDLKAL